MRFNIWNWMVGGWNWMVGEKWPFFDPQIASDLDGDMSNLGNSNLMSAFFTSNPKEFMSHNMPQENMMIIDDDTLRTLTMSDGMSSCLPVLRPQRCH